MKKLLAIATAVLLSAAYVSMPASASTPKAKVGASCSSAKVSAKVKVAGKTLVCSKTAKGSKVWKVTKATIASPALVTSATPIAVTSIAVGEPNPSAPVVGVYPIVLDPNGGGSSDPTPRTPEQAESVNQALAPAPTGLALSNITENAVTVSWDPIPHGALYQVYIRYNDSYESFGIDHTYSSHTFRNLTPGWAYTVGLHAALPVESNIATVAFQTLGSRPPVGPTLDGPTSVTATADNDSVSASWAAVEGASYYSVSLYDNGMVDGGMTSYGAPGLSHTFTGLMSGRNYRLTVAAIVNGSLTRTYTVYVKTTNTNPTPPAPQTGAQIYSPSNLQVVSVTPTTVTVSWDEDPSAGITLWSVYARQGSSFSSTGFAGDARTATLINLSPGVSYEIGVKGFDGSNWTTLITVGLILPTE
jgi:hypothetical protein